MNDKTEFETAFMRGDITNEALEIYKDLINRFFGRNEVNMTNI